MFGKSIHQKGYTPQNINKLNPLNNGHPIYSNTERTNQTDRYSSSNNQPKEDGFTFDSVKNNHRKSTSSNFGLGTVTHQQQQREFDASKRHLRRNSQRESLEVGNNQKCDDLVIRECEVDEYSQGPGFKTYQPPQFSSNKKQRMGPKNTENSRYSALSKHNDSYYNSQTEPALQEINMMEENNHRNTMGGLSSRRVMQKQRQSHQGIPQSSSSKYLQLDESSEHNISTVEYHDLRQQIEVIKQFINEFQREQVTAIKKIHGEQANMKAEYIGGMENFAEKVSTELSKIKKELSLASQMAKEVKIDITKEKNRQSEQFELFSKDQQERIESLLMEINSVGGLRKSHRNEDMFGVDLKSSGIIGPSAVGASMSMSMQQSESMANGKVLNQINMQIESMKSDIEKCKEQLQSHSYQIKKGENSLKMVQDQLERSQKKEYDKSSQNGPNNQVKSVDLHVSLDKVQSEVIKSPELIQKIKQILQQKVPSHIKMEISSNVEPKIVALNTQTTTLTSQTKDLYKVYQDIDSNIKGMNAEFTRVINGTVIKKEKMLEAKVNGLDTKMAELGTNLTALESKLQAQNSEKPSPEKEVEKLKGTISQVIDKMAKQKKLLKVRNSTPTQSSTIKKALSEKDCTYMMDEDGFLLDSQGCYLLQEQENGKRERIRVGREMLYLLESSGISITQSPSAVVCK